MKISILFLLSFLSYFSFAQKKLPVIKASSKKALIIEGEDERHNWHVSPETKLDIHTISKILTPTWIKFYTDIDSIKVKIKPNENFDFIVLLNNKDTCYTRIESPPIKNYSNQQPATHDTIPFTLTEFNNIKLQAILNKADTLAIMFDSGATGLSITDKARLTKAYSLKNSDQNNTLQIKNLIWDSLPYYPITLSGQGMDGTIGWDLFDGKIVEIDYDKSIFIVHTKLPGISKAYSKFEMEYTRGYLCIEGSLQVKNVPYKSRFLFDNGYQRTIMLDTLLMQQQHYPKDMKVIKEVIMKNEHDKEVPVITVNNERLNLGKHSLFNIPVQLMTAANPARFSVHILGNEILKRFNTILDFENNCIYLLPNSLHDLPYKDAR